DPLGELEGGLVALSQTVGSRAKGGGVVIREVGQGGGAVRHPQAEGRAVEVGDGQHGEALDVAPAFGEAAEGPSPPELVGPQRKVRRP
ncbi:MAG: hypothetical protein H0U15_11365, partial [Geodermatophilaceae bacterium]|nr:hypothetical protein [Geodermatophilaceae bacterium]